MKSKETRLKGNKYSQLRKLGSKFKLSFASPMVINNKTIVLDKVNKRILVTEIKNNDDGSYVIDLDKVNGISIKKDYAGIKPGELISKKFEEFLNSIHLQFELNDKSGKITLPFYKRKKDKLNDLTRLDKCARYLQMILSEMIGPSHPRFLKEMV